jgi:hypothetical protein
MNVRERVKRWEVGFLISREKLSMGFTALNRTFDIKVAKAPLG